MLHDLYELTESNLSDIFSSSAEEAKFKDTNEKRLDAVIEDEDHLCYALDPRVNWYNETSPKQRREVESKLLLFIREKWSFCDEEKKRTLLEFHEFSGRTGVFRNNAVFWDYDKNIDPLAYWQSFCDTNLSQVALSLFSMITPSGSVERCFSQQKLIHSQLRNKLKQQTVEKIVSISFSDHNGTRMNSRKEKRKQRETAASQQQVADSDSDVEPGASVVGVNEEDDIRSDALDLAINDDTDTEEDITDPEHDLTARGDVIPPSDDEEDDPYAFPG